jgi:hypothetical protein
MATTISTDQHRDDEDDQDGQAHAASFRSEPMATGRPATAWSRAVIPAQPGVGAAAAGE